MATRPVRRVAYGLTEALADMAPRPIQAKADPTVADKAHLGTIWVNVVSGTVFILVSIAANAATWVQAGGGGGGGNFSSVTVDPGDVDVTSGDINATAGTLTVQDAVITEDLTTNGNGEVDLNADTTINLTITGATPSINFSSDGNIDFGARDESSATTNIDLGSSQVGKATFTGFTIANGATETFTITNTSVSATSGIILSIADTAAAATEFVAVKQVPGAGSFDVTVRNDGVTQADGDIIISFIIL